MAGLCGHGRPKAIANLRILQEKIRLLQSAVLVKTQRCRLHTRRACRLVSPTPFATAQRRSLYDFLRFRERPNSAPINVSQRRFDFQILVTLDL